ncbi:MAG: hypothetical protein OEZ13_05265 [Spirochaetia bacterium]|nr:hypothetical protein [Spirochaetia bacterium]
MKRFFIKPRNFYFLICLHFFCATGEQKQEKKPPENIIEEAFSSINGEEIITQNYRTIYIHNFSNKSFQGDLISRLKEKLQIEFQLDTRLKPISDKDQADLWLMGDIEIYHNIPTYFDKFGEPRRFMMSIGAIIWVRINSKIENAFLLERRKVRYDTAYSPHNEAFETEFMAQERLLDMTAKRIVLTVFDGWHTRLKTDQELGYEKSKENENWLENDKDIVIPKDMPKEERDKIKEKLEELKYK